MLSNQLLIAGIGMLALAMVSVMLLVQIGDERGSAALVLGERAHGRLGEVFLGSVSRDVIRYAPCPVVVVKHAEPAERSRHKPS